MRLAREIKEASDVGDGTNLLTTGSKKDERLIFKAIRKGEISKAALQESAKDIALILAKFLGN